MPTTSKREYNGGLAGDVPWSVSAGIGFQKGKSPVLGEGTFHTPVKACQPAQEKARQLACYN